MLPTCGQCKQELKNMPCATNKCKRHVVEYWNGDYWCSIDLKRVKQLHKNRV